MSETQTVAIVMSRMSRLITPEAVWLSGLRACLRRIRGHRQTLLAMMGTAGADFVLRGAHRLEIEMRILPDDAHGKAGLSKDQFLIEQAEEVLVLGVRKDGNMQQLLTARHQTGRGGVCLVDLPGLQPDAVRQDLLRAGATAWVPPAADLRPFHKPHGERDEVVERSRIEVISLSSHPPQQSDLFLTHTTRACPGPWPRQTADEYLDSLLDACPDGDHSTRMTLSRIVRQRLLISSGRTIRGQFPVVSFTAVPLEKLPDLRCFRTHRSHWDFEPYGVCIRREALERRGVRPAIYGTEQTWRNLAEVDRPFFQRNGDPSADVTTTSSLDWSAECEWRHQGDLDLAAFRPDELFVFVPTFEDAKLLQPHCPWPITLWPGEVVTRK